MNIKFTFREHTCIIIRKLCVIQIVLQHIKREVLQLLLQNS